MSEKTKIKVEPGTDGQNPQWPGEPPEAPKPGTDTENDGGKETIHIPIVR